MFNSVERWLSAAQSPHAVFFKGPFILTLPQLSVATSIFGSLARLRVGCPIHASIFVS